MSHASTQWELLHQKIQSRLDAIQNGSILKYHLQQFDLFCQNTKQGVCTGDPGQEDKVFDLLSAHWERLDWIVFQALASRSSSYCEMAKKLETYHQQAAQHYQRLSCVLASAGIMRSSFLSAPMFSCLPLPSDLIEIECFREQFPALMNSQYAAEVDEITLFEGRIPSLITLQRFRPDDLESFKLTEQSIKNLRKDGLPENILSDIEPLVEKGFPNEGEFKDTVKMKIGDEQEDRYKLILKYSTVEEFDVEIAYETAYIFWAQTPDFFTEIQKHIQQKLPETPQIIRAWIGDMIAKITGIVLLYRPLSKPEVIQPPTIKTDGKNPAELLMPYLIIATLQKLLPDDMETSLKEYKEGIDSELETATGMWEGEGLLDIEYPLLSHVGQPIITLRDLQQGFVKVVEELLSDEKKWDSLGEKTLWEVLKDLYRQVEQKTNTLFWTNWGEIIDDNRQEFIKSLPHWGEIPDAEIQQLQLSHPPCKRALPLSCALGIVPKESLGFFKWISRLLGRRKR